MIIFYYLNYILVIVLILKRDITDSQEYPVHIYHIKYVHTGGNQTWHFLHRGLQSYFKSLHAYGLNPA